MIGYILLSIIIITLGWTTFNLTRKVERLETWIEDYAQRIQDTQQVLKEIDSKGTFESDDEVGFFFQELKELGEILNNLFEEEVEDAPTKEEKKKEEKDLFWYSCT